MRQSGRPIADSVLDLKKVSHKILKENLNKLLSKILKIKLEIQEIPFSENTDKNIISLIKKLMMTKNTNIKKFWDL